MMQIFFILAFGTWLFATYHMIMMIVWSFIAMWKGEMPLFGIWGSLWSADLPPRAAYHRKLTLAGVAAFVGCLLLQAFVLPMIQKISN